MSHDLKSLSIVIPCHNEEEVLGSLYKNLKDILDCLMGNKIESYELVFVNNGSTDGTIEKMLSLYEKDESVVIVDLRNNFGYQGSITAGLYHASNEMIVTIDADLQDDPNKIEEMIEKHYEGFDLVLGVRENRDSDSFLKRNSAEVFYRFMNFLGVNSVKNHGDFRLMSKSLLNDFKQYNERNRYIRGMVLNLESKYAIVKYPRTAREFGETKFNFNRMIGLAFDGITSFSIAPIRMISLLGLIMFLMSLTGISYILYQKFLAGVPVEGWTFVALSISLFGGLNSLFIGVVGEYVGKNYIESKRRPNFTVRKLYTKKINNVS